MNNDNTFEDIARQFIAGARNKNYEMKDLTINLKFPTHPALLKILYDSLDQLGMKLSSIACTDLNVDYKDYSGPEELLEAMQEKKGRMLPSETWVELLYTFANTTAELANLFDSEISEWFDGTAMAPAISQVIEASASGDDEAVLFATKEALRVIRDENPESLNDIVMQNFESVRTMEEMADLLEAENKRRETGGRKS